MSLYLFRFLGVACCFLVFFLIFPLFYSFHIRFLQRCKSFYPTFLHPVLCCIYFCLLFPHTYFTRAPFSFTSANGHSVKEEQRADGVVSTLTINKTTTKDFASYNCSVINEYGVDTHQILLQRQRKYSIILYFLPLFFFYSMVSVYDFFLQCDLGIRFFLCTF